jgi:hypothetical protein
MTTPLPPREYPAYGLGDRDILVAFLDFHRATVHRKVLGLGEEDAWRRFVPSLTSAAGIVKHLSYVEQSWFRTRLAGERDLPGALDRREPGRGFRAGRR